MLYGIVLVMFACVCVICLRDLCVIYRVILNELFVLRGCVVFVCSLNGFVCVVNGSLYDGVFCLCVSVCCCVFCG